MLLEFLAEGYTGDLKCLDCGEIIEYGYATQKLCEVHDCLHHDAVKATCQKEGNIEFWECTVCGNLFKNAACTQQIAGMDDVFTKKDKTAYISPAIKAITIRERQILCQSTYGLSSPSKANNGYGYEDIENE